MRNPRVLVTGVGSNVGQGVAKALRAAFPGAFLLGTDCAPLSAGFFALDEGRVLPSADGPGYVAALKEVCLTAGIELVLVASHGEVLAVARARADLEASTSARVVVSAPEAVERCIDKYATVECLRAAGCAFPQSTVDTRPEALTGFLSMVGLPVVVKPRRGQGSKRVSVVSSAAQVREACDSTPDPIVQEHLGSTDEEYTVAVLADRDGRVASATAMRRTLSGGTTVVAETGSFPEIVAEAARVAVALGVIGPVNVQMRLTSRGPVTFEVNPRFSGTTGMRALAGWNDAAAVVRHFLWDEAIALAPPRPGRVLRYYDEVFVPEESAHACVTNGGVRADSRRALDVLTLFGPHRA